MFQEPCDRFGEDGKRLAATCLDASGYRVDKGVYLAPHDIAGLRRLYESILRWPFSLGRVARLTDDGSVIYRAEIRTGAAAFPVPPAATCQAD